MTNLAAVLSVAAVLLALAAGPRSRWERLAFRSALGTVGLVVLCLVVDLFA